MVDPCHHEHSPVGSVIIDTELVGSDRTHLRITIGILGRKLIKGTRKRKQVAFGGHFAAYPERTVLYLT